MKKGIACLVVCFTLSALSACEKNETDFTTLSDEWSENDNTMQESILEGKTEETGECNDVEWEGILQDQTFDTFFDGWGEVTFASFAPEPNDNNDGDARFKLLKDGKVIYDFPGMSEDNTRFNQEFTEIAAVAFKDYNADGRTDIIILIRYVPQSGPDSYGEAYTEVRIYTQQDGTKEFVMDSLVAEFMMKQHYNQSISSVMDHMEEYWDYYASMDGTRSLDEQLRIIAANIDMCRESILYDTAAYYYAVTDLDRNGRPEMIVSSCQGTGLYTDSYFYEVNADYDGLVKCTTNFPEGDSQADIIVGNTKVFYEADSNLYHYIFEDVIRVGAGEQYGNKRAIILQDSQITQHALAFRDSTNAFMDADGKEITEEEYLGIEDTVFADYEQYNVSLKWREIRELDGLAQDEIKELLQESYEGFQFTKE